MTYNKCSLLISKKRKKAKHKVEYYGHNHNLLILLFLTLIPQALSTWDSDDDNSGGYYAKFQTFMGEVSNTMRDVMDGIDKLHKGFKNVEEFLDATVDEDCLFECPNSFDKKIPNLNHRPTSNGCGSPLYGEYFKLSEDMLPITEFVDCCHQHDICYETCNEDKDMCDLKFKKCLYKRCSSYKESVSKLKHKGCQAGAKILHMGTTALGCKPYLEAQRQACICQSTRSEL